MHYAYSTSTPGPGSWIKNVHKVTNLEASYAAQFSEVHVTIPKTPGDKDFLPGLPHITLVTVKDYRYHWYIVNNKISDKMRTEQIGRGNIRKSDSWNSDEKKIAQDVLSDIKERSWC
jgi:hypothetical protein